MSNLSYQQAFDLAVSGKKVKRASWPAGQYLVARGGRLIIEGQEGWDASKGPNYYRQDPIKVEGGGEKPNEDKYATDWAIYEDEIATPESSAPASTETSLKANYKNNTKPEKNS